MPKIGQASTAISSDQDVGWFDVAMDDRRIVDVADRVEELPCEYGRIHCGSCAVHERLALS
jgi:hypothetical protein